MSSDSRPPRLVWDWSAAIPAAIYALPGAIVALTDRPRGLALETVLGVAIAYVFGLGLPALRRRRR
jgi:hypothetical protein